jgi:hypothetical protein
MKTSKAGYKHHVYTRPSTGHGPSEIGHKGFVARLGLEQSQNMHQMPCMNVSRLLQLKCLCFCRFDCLCVVKDQVDPQLDERLAKFVVESHHKSHPSNAIDELDRAAMGAVAVPDAQQGLTIDQNLLKLYIAYAKQNCHPKLQNADTNKMVQVGALIPADASN